MDRPPANGMLWYLSPHKETDFVRFSYDKVFTSLCVQRLEK
jgi:hypothetical protein